MTNNIITALEQTDCIEHADSWPTGAANDGPEEYGLNTTGNPEPAVIEDVFETTLVQHGRLGFYLEPRWTPDGDDTCSTHDVVITVHQHPLGRVIDEFFTEQPSNISWGVSWDPGTIWSCYDDSPYLNLVAPGLLDGYFDIDVDSDVLQNYDEIIQPLHEHLINHYDGHEFGTQFEVLAADSDHCHFQAGYNCDYKQLLEDTYEASCSFIWDDAGQLTGWEFNARWMPVNVIVWCDGTAQYADASEREFHPQSPADADDLRQYFAVAWEEHLDEPNPDDYMIN